MNRDNVIKLTQDFVRQRMQGLESGHDWWHIDRVRNIAIYINERESMADPFTLEIAALLHDTVDSKFFNKDSDTGYKLVENFMEKAGLDKIKVQVIDVIRNVSFSNTNPSGNLADPVLLILQDADKLDAIGAIGIARAFNYGGFRNNPIYIPAEKGESNGKSTIGHFYDKLLKLRAMMNTKTGRELAEGRHKILEKFLEQFYLEWEGEYSNN